mmetsp:Transcript_126058/g.364766  ORF Transcript_126058/g.364766 Transcript_126058/m.364766 type:complete len:247 (+) Transcript_126058:891-1631(+)
MGGRRPSRDDLQRKHGPHVQPRGRRELLDRVAGHRRCELLGRRQGDLHRLQSQEASAGRGDEGGPRRPVEVFHVRGHAEVRGELAGPSHRIRRGLRHRPHPLGPRREPDPLQDGAVPGGVDRGAVEYRRSAAVHCRADLAHAGVAAPLGAQWACHHQVGSQRALHGLGGELRLGVEQQAGERPRDRRAQLHSERLQLLQPGELADRGGGADHTRHGGAHRHRVGREARDRQPLRECDSQRPVLPRG